LEIQDRDGNFFVRFGSLFRKKSNQHDKKNKTLAFSEVASEELCKVKEKDKSTAELWLHQDSDYDNDCPKRILTEDFVGWNVSCAMCSLDPST
jgi:hypothetical protein